ncbi:aldo/keto reductase family oxidoreductase [Amycolatopsis sp. NPDC059657]|uniref:aldo/keto reductase n=1 Tax=Amycolatopsis sp. NPDC059657 TaxID=3346899 RepID=UPI00367001EE
MVSAAPPAPRAWYGCMGLGGSWDKQPYEPRDIEAAELAVSTALEVGITAFDHADIYRFGKAESVFGELIARDPGLRKRIVLQTKCGIRLAEDGMPGHYDLRGASILERVERSLARLRTDHVDVLLLHRPDPLARPEEVAEALTKLRDQGLVKHFGVSNMSAEQIQDLEEHLDFPLVANQLEMSLASRAWVEAGVLVNTAEGASVGFPSGVTEYCRRRGMQIQAWGALARGRYSGQQETEAEHATAELVSAIATARETTPETVVLWWLQRHPARISPVIGTTNPDRIRACADSVRREPELSHEEWYRLWISARGNALP